VNINSIVFFGLTLPEQNIRSSALEVSALIVIITPKDWIQLYLKKKTASTIYRVFEKSFFFKFESNIHNVNIDNKIEKISFL
jgi:hypothetical protein